MGGKYKYPIVSAVGIVVKDRQVLITKRKIPPFLNQWVLPGGKIDYGESVEQGVIREVYEEVGLTAKTNGLFAFKESLPTEMSKYRHYLILYFLLHIEDFTLNINSEEISEVVWLKSEDIHQYEISPKTEDVIREYFNKLHIDGDNK